MIIPVQFILFQVLTILVTVIIEAYMFNWKFNINRQKSIELSFTINFISYFINWIYCLIIQWLILDRFNLKSPILIYTVLGKISDTSLVEEISSFFIGCIFINFILVTYLEFFSFHFISKLILVKEGDNELYDFLVNIIQENNAKKMFTIIFANLYSYLATIIIFYLLQVKSTFY